MVSRMDLIKWGLTTLVTAFIGSFLAGYLRKKGENLATHEDVSKLVEQMAAITTATKEIEAKISNDVWERQRKWEVKREALFEALRELANVEFALANLDLTFVVARSSGQIRAHTTDMRQATETWNTALVNFKKARMLALLVCSAQLA